MNPINSNLIYEHSIKNEMSKYLACIPAPVVGIIAGYMDIPTPSKIRLSELEEMERAYFAEQVAAKAESPEKDLPRLQRCLYEAVPVFLQSTLRGGILSGKNVDMLFATAHWVRFTDSIGYICTAFSIEMLHRAKHQIKQLKAPVSSEQIRETLTRLSAETQSKCMQLSGEMLFKLTTGESLNRKEIKAIRRQLKKVIKDQKSQLNQLTNAEIVPFTLVRI